LLLAGSVMSRRPLRFGNFRSRTLTYSSILLLKGSATWARSLSSYPPVFAGWFARMYDVLWKQRKEVPSSFQWRPRLDRDANDGNLAGVSSQGVLTPSLRSPRSTVPGPASPGGHSDYAAPRTR
jgi:hypothetical protein